MDTTVTDNISTILKNALMYLYGSTPTFTQNSADQRMQPAVMMGYGGAALSLFLSVFGAYSAGATAIQAIEASYFAFLEDFQDNEKYINIIDDDENGPLLHDFLTYYAWDLFILTGFVFWHVFFLIGMGALSSFWLMFKIQGYDEAATSNDVAITVGWKILLFGLLFGTADYLAGYSVSQNQTNVLKLVGFTPYMDTEDTYTKTSQDTAGGVTTTTTWISQAVEVKKDFFAMQEILDYWGPLFIAQRVLQIGIPYFYVIYLEVPVLMVLAMLFAFT